MNGRNYDDYNDRTATTTTKPVVLTASPMFAWLDTIEKQFDKVNERTVTAIQRLFVCLEEV